MNVHAGPPTDRLVVKKPEPPVEIRVPIRILGTYLFVGFIVALLFSLGR